MEFQDALSGKYKTKEAGKAIIDYAIKKHESGTERKKVIEKLYNSYNGIINDKKFDYITKSYGQQSKNKFITYKIGKIKIDQILGEFLKANINTSVASVNREAINRKYKEKTKIIGMLAAKSQLSALEKVQPHMNPIKNVSKMPKFNQENIKSVLNLKEKNEKACQHILTSKVKTKNLKSEFYKCAMSTILVYECYSKVERDENGSDAVRPIAPEDIMKEEIKGDWFCERSPYFGEVNRMYYHEICQKFELSKTEKEQLSEEIQEYNPSSTDYTGYKNVNGELAIPVYEIEWKWPSIEYTKVSTSNKSKVPYRSVISNKRYNKKEEYYKNGEKKGKFKIEKTHSAPVWTIVRIGKSLYKSFNKLEDSIVSMEKGDAKFRDYYSYTGMLLNTILGTRVSTQEMMFNLQTLYDVVMFMINRELRKIKGKVVSYNDAFMPRKTNINKILHEMTDDGIVRFNSSADGNAANEDLMNLSDAIKELDLGPSRSFDVLINIKREIEYTLDRITGINENRSGLTDPQQTATGIQTSVEASRTITYSPFYFLYKFIEKTLKKLIERTKINDDYLNGLTGEELHLGENEIELFKITKDLDLDSYDVYLDNGIFEEEIKNRVRRWIDVAVNAGELRSSDAAKAEMQDSFIGYVETLEKGWEAITKLKEKERESKENIENRKLMMQMKSQKENREDVQKHEKELEILKGQIEKEITNLKEGMQGIKEQHSNLSKEKIENEKINQKREEQQNSNKEELPNELNEFTENLSE